MRREETHVYLLTVTMCQVFCNVLFIFFKLNNLFQVNFSPILQKYKLSFKEVKRAAQSLKG